MLSFKKEEKKIKNPDSELWVKFKPLEELPDFAPNEISKMGPERFKDLDTDKKGDWLKYLKYDRNSLVS